MDLRELRTFRAVAELGSLSRAASYLHTAQPALSRHIKLLESDLRQLLFNRDGRWDEIDACRALPLRADVRAPLQRRSSAGQRAVVRSAA